MNHGGLLPLISVNVQHNLKVLKRLPGSVSVEMIDKGYSSCMTVIISTLFTISRHVYMLFVAAAATANI